MDGDYTAPDIITENSDRRMMKKRARSIVRHPEGDVTACCVYMLLSESRHSFLWSLSVLYFMILHCILRWRRG